MKSLTKATWKITLRSKREFWVTPDQKNFYIKCVEEGKKIVLIGSVYIGTDVDVVEDATSVATAKHLKDNHYLCDYGFWHAPEQPCFHKPEWVE